MDRRGGLARPDVVGVSPCGFCRADSEIPGEKSSPEDALNIEQSTLCAQKLFGPIVRDLGPEAKKNGNANDNPVHAAI